MQIGPIITYYQCEDMRAFVKSWVQMKRGERLLDAVLQYEEELGGNSPPSWNRHVYQVG
jgi:hypothetical protein